MKVRESDIGTLLIVVIAVIVMGYAMVGVKEFAEGLRDKMCNESTILCNKRGK